MRKFLYLLAALLLWQYGYGQCLGPYIGKPVPEAVIDSIIGEKSSPGVRSIAHMKDGKLYGIAIYRGRHSPISVHTFNKLSDRGRILLDYVIINWDHMKLLFPKADLSTGLDEKYRPDGSYANIVLSIYDYNEKDADGEAPEYYNRILKAWTIDTLSMKFMEINPKGLRHYNEGYGA